MAPSASWSVLDRRKTSRRPPSSSLTSSTSRATSSLRRRAPAKPNSSSVRSRASARPSPSGATIAVMTFVRAARILRGAVPWRRRIPDQTARTPASAVGVSKPATWCATLIEARRRRIVEGLRASAKAVR